MDIEPHCATCACGRRADVQGEHRQGGRGPGTISWMEHELAWAGYAAEHGSRQSAQRMHERGGFSYGELVMFLGREPTTWRARG